MQTQIYNWASIKIPHLHIFLEPFTQTLKNVRKQNFGKKMSGKFIRKNLLIKSYESQYKDFLHMNIMKLILF